MARSTLSPPPRRISKTSPDIAQLATDVLQLYDWAADVFTAVSTPFVPLAIVELTIANAELTATYTFATPRSDTNYAARVQAKSVVDSGSLLGAAAFTVRTVDYTKEGFTVTFCASPGIDNAITFDAFLFST